MKKIFFLILILPLQLIHAVSFDTNGNSAQVLIFPYYTVNKGFESHLSIENNKNDYKALKVRFRESAMGIDVLDFIIYLPPHSNIKLLIFNHEGNATIKNTSGGCTVPEIPSDGVSFRTSIYENLNISDAREGYVEVIEMGILNNDNIKSKLLQGDCSAMWTAQNDGSLSEGGAASNNGYYGSSQPTGFLPPSGGIQGDILLLNSATEESYTLHATGISDYSSTAQAYWSHNIDYYLLPSLASGDNKNSHNITWQTTQDFGFNNTDITPLQGVASGINPYPISQLLAKTHLQTEYFVDSDLEVMTEWIITNPMRAHNIFRENSFSSEGTLTANNGDTKSLNLPLNRAVNVISLNNNVSIINPYSIFGSPHQNSILVEPNFSFGKIRLGIDYNFLGSHQGAPLIATAIIRNKQLVQESVEQEQITIINTPPTINGVAGTPTENVMTKVVGETLKIIVKPKENFKGVVKVDGVIVAEGDVNSVLRYRHTVERDAVIDTSYLIGTTETACSVNPVFCNENPYTALLISLAEQYSGDLAFRLDQAIMQVQSVLGVTSDPFSNAVDEVNIINWQQLLANGMPLLDWVQIVQADINDGYLDTSFEPKIFNQALERPVTLVDESDYEIDKSLPTYVDQPGEGLPTEFLSLPEGTIVIRELYSTNTGEEGGSSVTSKDYLSDIAYIEIQDFSAITGNADDTIQRTIYQSFNVGQWKDKLNVETTVLMRTFLSEPILIFLPNAEKERVAEILIRQDEFAQAIQEYEKIITQSVEKNDELFNELIMTLGETGNAQLETTQINTSSAVLTAKIRNIAQPQALVRTSKSIVSKNTEPFEVFSGISLGYDIASNKLSAHSHSSLWYGIQSEENFADAGLGAWSTTSMLTPKVGFITKEDVTYDSNCLGGAVCSSFDLGAIDDSLNTGSSVNTVLFRNNPNSWVDVPQVMNTLSVAQVLLETVGASSRMLENIKPNKVSITIQEMVQSAANFKKEYEDLAKTTIAALDVSLILLELICEEHDSDCSTNIQNIQKLTAQMGALFGSFDAGATPDEISEEQYKRKAKEVKKLFYYAITGKKFVSDSLSLLQPILLAELVIRPVSIASGVEMKGAEAYILSRSLFTKNDTKKGVIAKQKFLQIWSKAIQKGFKPKKLLISISAFDSTVKQMLSLNNLTNELSKISGKELILEITRTAAEKANEISVDIVLNVVKNLTPAKYLDIIIASNKLGSMAYDFITDPTMVQLSMRKDATGLDIEHSIPDLKAIRYLKVNDPDNKLINKTIPGGHRYGKTFWNLDQENYIALGASNTDNHFLVMSGFKGSIENQSAFLKDDKSQVEALMDAKKINMLWHVKKFDKASEKKTILLKERNKNNAFNNNFINKPLENTFFWFNNVIINADSDNPVQNSVLNVSESNIDEYEVLDFTEFYNHEVGDFPLSHITPGVYSDYTHVSFKTTQEEALFANTLNMYVLPDFTSRQERVQDDAKIYKSSDGKSDELQLKFRASSNWNEVTENALWMVLKYSINGKQHITEPVKITDLPVSGMPIKAFLLPEGIDLNTASVYLYNDIVNAYIKHSGKSVSAVLKFSVSYISSHNEYPLIYLPTSKVQVTTESFLTEIDTDDDGIDDTWDAFPEDSRYQFDSDKDGMAARLSHKKLTALNIETKELGESINFSIVA